MTNTVNDTIASRVITTGTVFSLSEPEFVGRMPIRPSLPYQGVSRRTMLSEVFTDEQIRTYSREIDVSRVRGMNTAYVGFDEIQDFSPVEQPATFTITYPLPYVFVDINYTPDSGDESFLDMEDGDFEWGEE